jgi:ureidoacrylate peracid hydrolase
LDLKSRVCQEKCAVIVIDVQNDFCYPEGSSAKRGKDLSYINQMTPRLTDFLQVARQYNVPIIFVATEHDASTDSPTWLGRYGAHFDEVKSNFSCRKGTWGTNFYKVEPLKTEHVVIKNKYSAFVRTDLDSLLKAQDITSLLFTGVASLLHMTVKIVCKY